MNALLETLIASAADHASCGITIADCADPDLPLIYVNRAFEQITGYPAEEVLHRNCRLLQGEDRDQEARLVVRDALQNGTSCTVVLRNYRKDGTLFHNELRMSPIFDADGTVTHVVGVQTDITERVAAEQSRDRAKGERAAANEELDEFAHVVSHDLRAPVRAVASLTHWLEEDYVDKLDDEGKKVLGLINQRVRRLSDLIKAILNYSRAGRQLEDIEPVDLAVVVPQVVESLAPPATLQVTVSEGLPVIQSEPTRIVQVFQNLIGNAIQYMDKEQGRITVDGVARDDEWEFTVEDNGPGIEAEFHDKVFKIFQTLHAQEELESAGMGLTLVKKIVESYGGRVWLTSESEDGCTVHFTWLTSPPHPTQGRTS